MRFSLRLADRKKEINDDDVLMLAGEHPWPTVA